MNAPESQLSADAIIVLTGDAGRLQAGAALLRNGAAPRMLISGVHSTVSDDILTQSNLDQAQLDCCVTLTARLTTRLEMHEKPRNGPVPTAIIA